MTQKLLVKANSLKEFLALLNDDKPLEDLSLGDTWYSSSGFVDESILGGKRKVREILKFDYDFEGPVHFKARIGSVGIQLLELPDDGEPETYEVRGPLKDLRSIYNRVIEENAYYPNTYEVCFLNDWD